MVGKEVVTSLHELTWALCTSDSLLVNRDVNNIISYGLYMWAFTRHLKVHGL